MSVNREAVNANDSSDCQSYHSCSAPKRPRKSLVRRMVFDRGRLGLKVEHLLFRLRKPTIATWRGMLVLLLDSYGYEIAPLLRSDRRLTLAQKIARHLVAVQSRLTPKLFSSRPPIEIKISNAGLENSEAIHLADSSMQPKLHNPQNQTCYLPK